MVIERSDGYRVSNLVSDVKLGEGSGVDDDEVPEPALVEIEGGDGAPADVPEHASSGAHDGQAGGRQSASTSATIIRRRSQAGENTGSGVKSDSARWGGPWRS